jgi:hypothetical protein
VIPLELLRDPLALFLVALNVLVAVANYRDEGA